MITSMARGGGLWQLGSTERLDPSILGVPRGVLLPNFCSPELNAWYPDVLHPQRTGGVCATRARARVRVRVSWSGSGLPCVPLLATDRLLNPDGSRPGVSWTSAAPGWGRCGGVVQPLCTRTTFDLYCLKENTSPRK